MTNAAPRCWFHYYGSDDSAELGVRAELAAAGVTLHPMQNPPEGCGIVCFAQIDSGLLDFLGSVKRETRGCIIALAVSSLVVDPSTTWRLLAQGATEVLSCDGQAALQIRARMERWRVIDELAEFATSRASLAGESIAWNTQVRQIADVGRFTSAPILLVGESGTGKEELARMIAMVDARAAGDPGSGELVVFDCSTVVPELSGSELFGHERGAFTGAVASRDGAFSMAHGKTLFLDEIGELPMPQQTQLLRAVQEKKYKRVGGNVWQTSDFRLVCATNRNLPQLIEQGLFRLDLYHRISGWVFHTLPLRERREDILPLARFFVNAIYAPETAPEFEPAVREYLLHRDYQGNVRELRHLIERIVHRHVGPGPITAGDIPEEDRPAGEWKQAWPDEQFDKTISSAILLGAGLKEITQITTETAIRIAVQSEKGNLQRAAKKLGVTDRALQLRKAAGTIG
jgi:transcriptional regulator with GAF, ATPase, and Fis domain